MLWVAILVTGVGCYLQKLAGLVIPRRLAEQPTVQRFALAAPVALLAALIAVQALADGRAIDVDPARLGGLGAAVVALMLRAPFLAVLAVAAATTALLRVLGV